MKVKVNWKGVSVVLVILAFVLFFYIGWFFMDVHDYMDGY